MAGPEGGPRGPAARGLEGVVATTTRISSILDGTLTYAGYNIDHLASHATFEEAAYLLWHLELPDPPQLEALRRALAAEAPLPPEVTAHLRQVPGSASPMAVLRTAVSLLSLYDLEADRTARDANLRKAVRLTARLPVIVAAFHRLRTGAEPVVPRDDRGIAWNFLYMLHDREPAPVEARAMDQALVLHADHELNASTFAARVTAATLSDMYAAVTAGLAALKGPLHGGANRQVMAALEEIGSADRAGEWLDATLAARRRVPGFGHRVYRTGDPRARHLRAMSELLAEHQGDRTWLDLSVRLDDLVRERTGLFPNVDFYSAPLYHMLGIPRDLFPAVFAVSRVAGWTAHVMEQHEDNRLIRPRAEYVGPGERPWVPLERRPGA